MAGAPLALPQVTLCAVTSVNVAATLRGLETSLAQVNFAACKLFTHSTVTSAHPDITVVPIARLTSSEAYSDFLLNRLVDHVGTPHCLIVQWDGHVIDASQWRADFLDYDYVGAGWPQFNDGYDVGNGGFSLRSRRLMTLCRDPGFHAFHPEDLAIGRANRAWLESQGMRFAPRTLADHFSTERAGDLSATFGYHGVWLMPRAIGTEAFWDVYRTLDDAASIRHDFMALLRQVHRGRGGFARALRMIADHLRRNRSPRKAQLS